MSHCKFSCRGIHIWFHFLFRHLHSQCSLLRLDRHYAASFPQSSKSTIFLVDTAPAAACLENENGETPYDRAKESGLDRDVVKLMKRAAKQSGGHDSAGSLDALNRSKDRKLNYRDHYDQQTHNFVCENWAKDIKLLGYKF